MGEANGAMGSFIKLFDESNSLLYISEHEEQRIDAAVSNWVASGRTRDTLLDLDLPEGGQFKILASTITSWCVSTPESRLERAKLAKLMLEEEEELRAEVGFVEKKEWDT